ncbi:MAG: hypothetical protein QW478_10895 [Candidatus Micrarchaeaceae archaeon]
MELLSESIIYHMKISYIMYLKVVSYPSLADGASTTSTTLELPASMNMLAFTCGMLFMHQASTCRGIILRERLA